MRFVAVLKGLAVLSVLCPSLVTAAFVSGNELKAKLSKDDLEWFSGMGYVMGVADAFGGLGFCLPAGVTVGQMRELALKHLGQHPEKLHLGADSLLLEVFGRTWPCPKRSSEPATVDSPSALTKPKSKPKDKDVSPF